VSWKYNPFTNKLDEIDCPPQFKLIDVDDTPYDIKINDDQIDIDCSGGEVILKLPLLAAGRKKPYNITKIDSSANKARIQGNDISEKINSLDEEEIGVQFDSSEIYNRITEWGARQWVIELWLMTKRQGLGRSMAAIKHS